MTDKCNYIIFNQAPTVEITEETFNQVAVYNYKLQVDMFILSNGLQHFFCKRNTDGAGYIINTEIPDYRDLLTANL